MSAVAQKTNGRRPRAVAPASSTEGPQSLAQALLAFQSQAPKLRRDAVGQIQSRTYGYTTLDALLDDVVPLLQSLELLWSARVVIEDGAPAACYRMEHVPSGDFEEWTGPLPCVGPGPQHLGSAITYMRRYELQAYLNLAPGEDDDGAAASAGPVDRNAIPPLDDRAHDPAPAQPTAAPARPSERPITANQRSKLLIPRAKAAGLSDGDFANVVLAAAGDPPRSWRTEEHASQTLARLLDRLPARLKNPVLDGIAAAAKEGSEGGRA